ncbi:hypothetical protein BC830DRAFT_1086569 [Chytriomyces sp. MP71]|nr:hypothetical protein BC830DRAFT_1086569 [Chytriomyces sp. MP71]
MIGGQKTITMMWKPPATDVGPVTVNMVIAGNVAEPWQVVQSVQMMSAAGLAAGQQFQATNAGPIKKANAGAMVMNLIKGAVSDVANVGGTVADDLGTVAADANALGKAGANLATGKKVARK